MILNYDDFVGSMIVENKLSDDKFLKKVSKNALYNIHNYDGQSEYMTVEVNDKTAVAKLSAIRDEKLSSCKENATIYVSYQNNKPVVMYCSETCVDYKELPIDKFEYVTDQDEIEKCNDIFEEIKKEYHKINRLIIILNY